MSRNGNCDIVNLCVVLTCLFAVPFSQGTDLKSIVSPVSLYVDSSKNSRLVRKQETGRVLTSKDFEHHMWKTQGIILAFNEWPSQREKVQVLKELEALGVEKTKELPVTKVWFLKYTDNRPRNVIEAHSICRNLTEKFLLKYCRPERMPKPRNWRPGRDSDEIGRYRH